MKKPFAQIYRFRAFLHGGLLLPAIMAAAPVCIADEAEDQFNFATGLLIRKEYELAAEEFSGLLKKHPGFQSADVALFRLGESLAEMKDYDRAVEAFKKITVDHPQSARLPRTYYRLGQISSRKNHRRAAQYYATVAEKWPKNKLSESALYWSAEELFLAEDWNGAAKAYRAVITRYPSGKHVAHSMYSLGWSEFKRNDFGSSAKSFRDFLGKFQGHDMAPECRLKLAESLYKLKKYDEAHAMYSAAGAVGGKIAQEAAIGSAWCLYNQGKLREAADSFSRAAGMLGKTARAAVCVFNAGNAFIEGGDFEKAMTAFSRIAADHPAYELAPEAAYWKGYSLVRLKRFNEAADVLDTLKSSGKLKRKEAELLHTLAEAEFGLKNYRSAADLYSAVARRFPRHNLADDASYGRMLALEKAGDIPAAESAGEEFFSKFPDSDVAHIARFALAEYRFRLGKYRAAAADFRKFLAGKKLSDLGDDVEYKLGWCAMNLNDPVEAMKRFTAVITKYPESPLVPEAVYMAGRAAEDGDDMTGARKHYESCVSNHAGTEYARRSDLALVLMDLDAKKYEAALTRVEAFIKKTPEGPLAAYAYVYRGEALSESGRFDEALASYGNIKGEKSEGSGADAAYGLAWVYRKTGKHGNAAEIFFKVAAMRSSKSQDAEFWGCRSLEDAGRSPEAAQHYEKFIAVHGASARADEAAYRQALCMFKAKRLDDAHKLYKSFLRDREKSDFTANALYDLAWLYKEKRNMSAMAQNLKRILEKFPESDLVSDVKFRLGEIAYDNEDYDGAASYYEGALVRGDVSFGDKILYKLGWCYKRLSAPEKAIEAYSRIVEKFPQSELVDEAHYRVGKIFQKSAKYAEAIKEYGVVGTGPFAEKALFQHAECLRAVVRQKEALAIYEKILTRFPNTEFINQVNLGKGHCLRSLSAFKDAIESYQSVVRATDTVEAASALLGTGYSYYAVGSYKDAAKAFLKVDILYGYKELKPEALDMVAKSWAKTGNMEKAKKYRDELQRRYPDSKFAKAGEVGP